MNMQTAKRLPRDRKTRSRALMETRDASFLPVLGEKRLLMSFFIREENQKCEEEDLKETEVG